jgi:hypothetical protein
MPYLPDSQRHADFVAALTVYQAALSPAQLAHGFADGRPAPPAYDSGDDERTCFAYACWFATLDSPLSTYAAGGHLPPIPPPLA